MQLFEIFAGSQNGQAIPHLAHASGVEPEQMEACLRSVIGDMTLAIERNTLNRGGLADFVKALGNGHHEYILDNPQAMADPRVAADGNQVLDHILGSKDKSRGVALRAAQASGMGDGLIRMLLPYIAQMLMGAIAKWARGSGGLGDIINKLPIPGGGGMPMPGGGGSGGGGGFELPRGELPRTDMPQGGYPMPPIPDGPSGGSPADGRTGSYPAPSDQGDQQGSGLPWPLPQGGSGRGSPFPFPFPFPQGGGQSDNGRFQIPWPGQQQPQQPRGGGGWGGGSGGGFELPRADVPAPQGGGYPMPPIPGGPSTPTGGGGSLPLPGPQQGNNPYGDLSDILKRGGSVPGSGSVGGIVRNILGGLLGFGGSGIVGWLVRLLVMRFGWSFLKRLLGRVLMGGR